MVRWIRAHAGPRQQANHGRLLASIVESSNEAIIGKLLAGINQSSNAGAECLFGSLLSRLRVVESVLGWLEVWRVSRLQGGANVISLV